MLWVDLAIVLVALAALVGMSLTVWGTARRFLRECKGLTVPHADPRPSRTGAVGAP